MNTTIEHNFLGCHWLEFDYHTESQGNYRGSSCCLWPSMPKRVEHEFHTSYIHIHFTHILGWFFFLHMHQCVLRACDCSGLSPKHVWVQNPSGPSRDDIHWRFMSILNWGGWQASSCKYQRHVAASAARASRTFLVGGNLLFPLPKGGKVSVKTKPTSSGLSHTLTRGTHSES